MSDDDYDTRRPPKGADGELLVSHEEWRTSNPHSPVVDWDRDGADVVELPGADLSGEEFIVPVVPKRPDEFTCAECFLVHHRTREARPGVCVECA